MSKDSLLKSYRKPWKLDCEDSEDKLKLESICKDAEFMPLIVEAINETRELYAVYDNGEKYGDVKKRLEKIHKHASALEKLLGSVPERSGSLLSISLAKYFPVESTEKQLRLDVLALKNASMDAVDELANRTQKKKQFKDVAPFKAACHVRDIFDRFGVTFSCSNTSEAATCLKIIFKYSNLHRSNPKDYLEEAVESQKQANDPENTKPFKVLI